MKAMLAWVPLVALLAGCNASAVGTVGLGYGRVGVGVGVIGSDPYDDDLYGSSPPSLAGREVDVGAESGPVVRIEVSDDRQQTFREDDRADILAVGVEVYLEDEGDVLLLGRSGNTVLDHSFFGAWLFPLVGFPDGDGGAFFGGVATDPDDVPRRGSASYQGAAAAVAELNGNLEPLAGDAEALADFEVDEVELIARLSTLDGLSWGRVDTGPMAIFGNDFRTRGGAVSDRGHEGDAYGVFNGRDAREMAGAFSLSGPEGRVEGSFAARR